MNAVDFLKGIDGDVRVIFHSDCDGCCSAAIVLAFLRQRGVKAVPSAGDVEEETLGSVGRAENVIIVDLAVDNYPEWLGHLKGRKVLIMDHHMIRNDLNKMGFIHVNPRFEKPDLYTSASLVTYDVCRKAGLRGFAWLAKVGAVGDRALEGSKKEKEASCMINSVKAIRKDPGLVTLAKYLSACRTLDEFLKNDKYVRLNEMLNDELEKQIALFELTCSGEVCFFELRSRYSMLAILSSKLLDMYPKKTIIVYSKDGDIYKVSTRSKTYNMAELVGKAAKGIGRAGGHPAAAGGTVTDFGLFRARLEKLLKK
ncbi:MAG: DHHA1 domain-containing protein [Candidatus Aenigmatarchaeota archaeon]